MDAGLTIRPLATATQVGVARVESAPVRQATPTELAAGQTVSANETTQRARNDSLPTSGQVSNPNVDRELVVDAEAREVIFRMIDTRTGHVMEQIPSESMMKLRKYAAEILAGVSVANSKPSLERVA